MTAQTVSLPFRMEIMYKKGQKPSATVLRQMQDELKGMVLEHLARGESRDL